MTNLKSKTLTTKKPHRCFSCHRNFKPGSKMNYWVGVYDGDFSAVYCCMTCLGIMNETQDPDGYPDGFVAEMLETGQTPEGLLESWKLSAV